MENIIDYKLPNVGVSVRQFKVIPNDDNLKELVNSENLSLAVYMAVPKKPHVLTNHLVKQINIDVLNDDNSKPVINLFMNVLLYNETEVSDPNDLWVVIYNAIESLKVEVEKKKIVDNKGNLVVIPKFLHSVENLTPFVYSS